MASSLSMGWGHSICFLPEFRSTSPEFESRLIERYPELTKMEVKICSLVRLKITSLDIATLFCLSERNIGNHRCRIRKKLGLEQGDDLYEVLAGI